MRRGSIIVGVMFAGAACSLTDLSDLRGDGGGDATDTSDANAKDAANDASDAADAAVLLTRCHAISSCVAPATYCCATCTDDDAGDCYFTSFQCVSATTFCNDDFEIPIGCSDQGSCPSGQICCGTFASGFAYFKQSSCSTVAQCNASPPSRIMCDPNASSPCPTGKTCLAEPTANYDDLFSCQ